MNKFFNLFKSARQRKFEQAKESKVRRLPLETDGKRSAVSHPTH